MKYTYAALDAHSKRKRGTLIADSEADALLKLRQSGLIPTDLTEKNERVGEDGEATSFWKMEVGNADIHKKKLPKKKLIILFSQMSIMLKAGVNLSLAIEVMTENENNPYMRRILKEIHSDMLAGLSISSSMEKFEAFDTIIVNIIRSGEADGRMERSFGQVATVIEKQSNIISKVQSAAIYPCILLVLVIGVVTLLTAFVLPNFIEMFEGIGKEMPAITVAIMSFSKFLNTWWLVILIVVILIAVGFITARKKSLSFAIFIDKLMLKIPLVGALIRNSQTARFARILSTLLESGQDFLSSLNISQSVLSNKYMSVGFTLVADEVRMGNPISASMSKLDFLEPVLISMVRAGEESGSLSTTLSKMADLYEAQTDESTKRIMTMVEPLMTVVIAGIVGVVVIGIAMPMLSMFDLVGNV